MKPLGLNFELEITLKICYYDQTEYYNLSTYLNCERRYVIYIKS